MNDGRRRRLAKIVETLEEILAAVVDEAETEADFIVARGLLDSAVADLETSIADLRKAIAS